MKNAAVFAVLSIDPQISNTCPCPVRELKLNDAQFFLVVEL
jgi:hypothetical protein